MIQDLCFSSKRYYFTVVITLGVLIVMVIGCKPQAKSVQKSNLVIWNSPQQTVVINSIVGWKSKFVHDSLTQETLPEFLASPNKYLPNNSKFLFLGPREKYPYGWFHIRVVNPSSVPQKVILDQDNHLRCDGLQIYSIQNGNVLLHGKVKRTDPLVSRAIPYYIYAIPVVLPAKDTLDLIIQTERDYGIHEVNLSLATYPIYLRKTIKQVYLTIFEVAIMIFCFLLMTTVGWIFRERSMIFLGIYCLSISLALLSFPGFLDSILPDWSWGFQRSGILPSIPFLLNILYQPYGMEIMKDVPKNEYIFKRVSYLLMIVNALFFLSFMLPISLFNLISPYLPKVFILATGSAILWLFYSAIIALFRARIYYFISACCFALLPFIVDQFVGFFVEPDTMISFKLNLNSFTLSLLGISILSIYQLRNKLVSRKKHESQLAIVKSTMEEIRAGEIQTVGRNLHDNVGNILASALGYLNLKHIPISTLQAVLHEAIREIRFISHNLVKNESLPISLKLARLTERFDEFSSAQFFFRDYTQKILDQRLTDERQQNLYYIVQELFTNILKHARAKEISLQIFEEDGASWITIEDDGICWDTQSQASEGIGLQNIKQRASLANFTITIDSSLQGTNAIIEIHNENNLFNH